MHEDGMSSFSQPETIMYHMNHTLDLTKITLSTLSSINSGTINLSFSQVFVDNVVDFKVVHYLYSGNWTKLDEVLDNHKEDITSMWYIRDTNDGLIVEPYNIDELIRNCGGDYVAIDITYELPVKH